MVRCRVSRQQLIDTLDDVESLKAKIAKCKEVLKKASATTSKAGKEEGEMKGRIESMKKTIKHSRERKMILLKETSKLRASMASRKREFNQADQEYYALVNEYHKLSDKHAESEKTARGMFKSLSEMKKQRDAFRTRAAANEQKVHEKQAALEQVREQIKRIKAALNTGMSKVLTAGEGKTDRKTRRIKGKGLF